MDTEFIKDLPPEKREELFRLAQRNDVFKWLIGSALIALLGWVSTTYFQNREANLQSARFTHERELQQLQFLHTSAIERKEAERTYLSEYLAFALEEDIEKRLRFAHYFKSLVADSDMAPLWDSYYEELLAASGVNPDEPGSAEVLAAARIGGLESLASGRTISRIFLGTSANLSIKELEDYHLSSGFSDVGVHFLVRPDGSIERGRSLDKTPAFAAGFNSGSIAIALACENIAPNEDGPVDCAIPLVQLKTVSQMIADLVQEYDLDMSSVRKRSDVRPMRDRFGGMFETIKSEAAKLIVD